MADLRAEQNLLLAIIGGLVASVIAALIWALITYATGYKIGFVAIGVGFLVGFAVQLLGKGISPVFGIVGAVFALLGCLLGDLFATLIFAWKEGMPFSMLLSTLLSSPGIIFEVMKSSFSPIDLLFYAIAIYEGYRFSIRQTGQ